MHRFTFSRIFVCALLIGLGLLGPFSVPEGRVPRSVQAQAGDDPRIDLVLLDEGFSFQSLPNARVNVELSDAQGEKASSAAVAGADGKVQVTFGSFFLADQGIAVVSVGGRPTAIRAGDQLRIAQRGAQALSVEVPELSADIDALADRVSGSAPANAKLDLTIRPDGSDLSVARSVIADASGQWSLDLAGETDLVEGKAEGSVSLMTPDRDRFSAHFAALSASITMGADRVSGMASAGTQIGIALDDADGTPLELPAEEVLGEARWERQLGGGGGFGPGPARPAEPARRIAAGDVITLTHSGGLIQGERSLRVTLPDLQIDLDPATDQIRGLGPTNTKLQLQASSLTGDSLVRSIMTDEDGAWALDLSGEFDLGPGWRASVAWQPEAALEVMATNVVPYLDIGVHTDGVFGLASPGTPVTATLFASDGRQKSQSSARTSALGEFRLRHGGGGGFSPFGASVVRAEPGDRLELAFIAGDPQVYTIPNLSARLDLVAEAVEGIATPGALLHLRFDKPSDVPSKTVQASGSGDYRIDLADAVDLQPGAYGRLFIHAGPAHSFSLPLAAPRLNLEIGSGQIAGTAAPGRRAQATLHAPDGTVIAEAEADVLDDTLLLPGLDPEIFASLVASFDMEFLDVAGDPVPLQPGDRVHLKSGDNLAEMVVPPMDGVVFVDQDLVTGRTDEGRVLDLNLRGFDGKLHQTRLAADERGNFSHAWTGEIDLQYNDQVGLNTEVDGHALTRALNVPGLFLDLDASVLSGSLRPETAFGVAITRDGRALARGQGFASASGVFRIGLVDSAGEPIPLEEGDRIEVAPEGQAGEHLVLNVPLIDIEADAETDAIHGLATPGGSLTILARDALQGRFALSQAWPLIEADGRWTADLIPGWDVAPGTAVDAQYRLPVGHVASRTHYEPLLRVEHGGPNVCGFAPPGGDLTAQLNDEAGLELARASSMAGYDGRFQLGFADLEGAGEGEGQNQVTSEPALRILESGQTVRALLGGEEASVALPALDVSMDWQSGRLSGSGPADTLFQIAFPAQRCVDGVGGGDFFGFAMLGRTGPDGAVQGGLPIPVGPGEGIELSFIQPDGHVAYRQFYRLLGEIFVDTERVRGLTVSGGLVRAQLLASGGEPRAESEGRADADGRFDLRFLDANGDPIVIEAGDSVELSAGGESPTIVVETLGFDWSRGDRVVGEAPAGRPLMLDLKLKDGRMRSVERIADDGGRFAFEADELPPRGGWTLDDIVGLRVTMAVEGGHRIIAQTEGFDAEPIAPEPEGPATIFLPRVMTGRGGAVMDAAIDTSEGQPRGRWIPVAADHRYGAKTKELTPMSTLVDRKPKISVSTTSSIEYSIAKLPWKKNHGGSMTR